jgi:hypothetical protein
MCGSNTGPGSALKGGNIGGSKGSQGKATDIFSGHNFGAPDPLDIWGYRGSAAAEKAAALAAAAAQKAGDEYKSAYSDAQDIYKPYNALGEQSATMLKSGTADYNSQLLRKFGANDFQEDPGYKFRLAQGQNAIEGSAAARGGLLSGATMKAMNEYGQNFASDEYQNAYDRYGTDQQRQYERLMGTTGIGQQSSEDLMGARYQTASGYGNAMMGQGQVSANGVTGSANAKTQGMKTGVQAVGSVFAAF